VGEATVVQWVRLVERFSVLLPRLWALVCAGRLEVWRAQVVLDAAEELVDEADVVAFEERILGFLERRGQLGDGQAQGLVSVPRAVLARAVRYHKQKFARRGAEEGFAAAYRKRRVSLRVGEDGIASLGVVGAAPDLVAADYRVTLIAKRLSQAVGEERSLEQLRADVVRDLLLGRLHVPASTGALEHPDTLEHPDSLDTDQAAPQAARADASPSGDVERRGDSSGPPQGTSPPRDAEPAGPGTSPPGDADPPRRAAPPDGAAGAGGAAGPAGAGEGPEAGWAVWSQVGAFARPVINVTVSLETLAGFSDDPGVLAGHGPIPAELARQIAARPGSTWYRMLTDARRECAELSVRGYTPSPPIWRQVVADQPQCLVPGCLRPAPACELDHTIAYPHGPTATTNLAPLCRRHHKVKHAMGYKLTTNPDGSHTLHTRHGSTHHIPRTEQPTTTWPHAA
jgi:hypothetical protein